MVRNSKTNYDRTVGPIVDINEFQYEQLIRIGSTYCDCIGNCHVITPLQVRYNGEMIDVMLTDIHFSPCDGTTRLSIKKDDW